MAPVTITVLVVEQTLKNGHHEHPFPQGVSYLLLLQERLSRSANWSDLGSSYYSF